VVQASATMTRKGSVVAISGTTGVTTSWLLLLEAVKTTQLASMAMALTFYRLASHGHNYFVGR